MSRRTIIAAAIMCSAGALLAGCDRTASGDAQAAVPSTAAIGLGSTQSQASGPRAVVAAIEEATRECRAHGGRFVAGEGFDTRLALNNDEAPDHVLNYQASECQGANDDYSGAARGGLRDDGCGRDGCRVDVFVSGPRGHQRVLSEPVWNVQFVRDANPARLRISASNMPGCNASYAAGCHAEWGWNGSAFTRLRWLRSEDMAAMEGQDEAGRPVDENGPPAQAAASTAPGASGGLPFREGEYVTGETTRLDRGNGWENVHTEILEISTTSLVRHSIADSDECRIVDRIVQGAEARLTFQCVIGCGNGGDGPCPTRYDRQRHIATVRALGPGRISVRVQGAPYDYWTGEYAYNGRAR